MKLFRARVGSFTLAVIVSAYLLALTNGTFFDKGMSYFEGNEAQFAALVAAVFLLSVAALTTLSVKYLTKPIFILLILVAGSAPYFTDTFGTIIDRDMIQNAVVTTTGDPRDRTKVVEWVIAALNSVDLPSQPWALFRFISFPGKTPEAKLVEDFLKARLDRMEAVLADREWLPAGRFTVADLLMADVLRQVERFDGLANYPACHAYVGRATARPAFVKAYDDQMAHFAVADAA